VNAHVPPQPAPPAPPAQNPQAESIARGQSQFANLCVECHGSSGGGGIGPNLVFSSFNTFISLRAQIDAAMPQTNPALCRDTASSTCATDVANYVLNVIQQGGGSSEPPDIDY
jgi:mono/diheme cytochrome c family protein